MPVGEQHHGGVAMAVAVVAGRFHQLLHLGVGEVLARPRCRHSAGVGAAGAAATVPLTVAGVTSAKCGFAMDFAVFARLCPINGLSWDRVQGQKGNPNVRFIRLAHHDGCRSKDPTPAAMSSPICPCTDNGCSAKVRFDPPTRTLAPRPAAMDISADAPV